MQNKECICYDMSYINGFGGQCRKVVDGLGRTMEDSVASVYERLCVPYEPQRAGTRGSGGHLYIPITRDEENAGDIGAETAETPDGGRQRSHPNTLGEGRVYYYHRDHLGSTQAVTDGTGDFTQMVEYTPWGEVFVELKGDSVFTTPYLFNGKELDEETGLYYYGARYYDPKMSVWYSTDPMELEQTFESTYIINHNNPLNYIDQNGREPKPAEAARIAAHVYGDKKDDILIGGWRVSKKYVVKNQTSTGLKSKVYERVVNGKVTEYVYATAGSEDLKDWMENCKQPFGMSIQYHEAAETAKMISEAIGDKELNYVGHSLGGGEAALNTLVTYDEGKGRKAFTFNAAGVSDITKIVEGSLLTPFQSEASIEAYILRTDPLNIIQNNDSLFPDVNGKRHYLWPKDIPSIYNGHSIDNVLKNFGVSNPNKYQKE